MILTIATSDDDAELFTPNVTCPTAKFPPESIGQSSITLSPANA